MIARVLELRTPTEHLFHFLETTEGKTSFLISRLFAPRWQCLFSLLVPFAVATEMLRGDSYPTLAIAVPCLRVAKRELQCEDMFVENAVAAGDHPSLHLWSRR